MMDVSMSSREKRMNHGKKSSYCGCLNPAIGLKEFLKKAIISGMTPSVLHNWESMRNFSGFVIPNPILCFDISVKIKYKTSNSIIL